jgi:hypothetical protein
LCEKAREGKICDLSVRGKTITGFQLDRASSLNDPYQHRDHGNDKKYVNNNADIPNSETEQPPDNEKNKYGPKHGR